MSKLTVRDFTHLANSGDNDPIFKGFKTKYVAEEKLTDKLPIPVCRVYAREKVRGHWPQAYILEVKHKKHKAYAIVSTPKPHSDVLEVRVVDKQGKMITRTKMEYQRDTSE
jgi:hypothetical protein